MRSRGNGEGLMAYDGRATARCSIIASYIGNCLFFVGGHLDNTPTGE